MGPPLHSPEGAGAPKTSASHVEKLIAASQKILEVASRRIHRRAKAGSCQAMELALALLKRHHPDLDMKALGGELSEDEPARLKEEVAAPVREFVEDLSFMG